MCRMLSLAVAANVGIGFMVVVAAIFLSSDLVVMGIIIGVIGFGIEIAVRLLEEN